MSESRFLSRVMSSIRRFRRDSRGNIAVTFALAAIPILSAIGCAVDYSLATRMKAKLQSAADAAAVASISKNSIGYNAASLMSGNGEVTAAETDAAAVFNGNLNGVNGFASTPSLTGTTVTKNGIILTANVTFTATVPLVFMKVVQQAIGLTNGTMTVSGSSSATASLPPYLDFYLMLDVSGSMGLPSTDAEQKRLSLINPDDFSVYPNGCTFACHFQASGACSNPSQGQKTQATPPGPVNSAYPTNGYCLGYLISRVSQAGYAGLLQTSTKYPMKGLEFPSNILGGLNSNVTPGAPNSLLTGNSASLPNSLTAVTSCPIEGGDPCIQLRADAVGVALNATQAVNGVDGLFATANQKEVVTGQFRIGLYPFVQYLYTYFPLTSSINNSPTNTGTINYAAANLATLLDTGNNPNLANLGSGGTHFDNAFPSMNNLITSVGDGSSPNKTQPFVFLVTDGAQNFQTQSGGNWAGSNSATVMPTGSASLCTPLKNRGIIISVLYIPYQPIQNPTTIFNNEDNVANANIPSIPDSLKNCASPGFYFTATTPADITTALNAMFNQSLQVAHITN